MGNCCKRGRFHYRSSEESWAPDCSRSMSSMDHLSADLVIEHATVINRQRLTFSVTEKNVRRSHVPTPVLVDSGNVRLRGFFIVEELITPSLLLCDREICRLDVHRIGWIRDLVEPKLGTKLPGPREL